MVNWTNVTNFADVPGLANTSTSGTFWVGILHMIWIIIMLALIGYGFEVAILVSSFLALVISFFLVYTGLVSWTVLIEFAGIVLFMFLYIIWSSKKDRTG